MIQLILHLKQPQPHTSLDGSNVVHVVEMFSPLTLLSARAWTAESNQVRIVNNVLVKLRLILFI
jgi:hypothetical protein